MHKTYAIGDIHGSLAKLRDLIAHCERDAGGEPMTLVFIGDYIDRGPDSRGVVDYVMGLEARLGANAIALKGNHEELAVAAADSGTRAGNWLVNGGDKTLRSYGVATAQELPADHLAWFRALGLSFDDGQRLFVHAGIDPARPLDDQDAHDLIWIREPFLFDERDHGRLIVHGHTPLRTGMPDLRANRLNIDTGAVFGGPLTAAVFVAEQRDPIGFIQVTE
jgi:diadenosine tetraphosphatase ApaH/serine/threonine PP2A family protein phosphatase